MTKEETKELIAEAQDRIALMQAYVDGKQIQYFNRLEGKWEDTTDPRWSQGSSYRIKTEIKCRPFRDVEECWQEMQKHRPFGWIKSNEDGHYAMVTTVDVVEGEKYIAISGNNLWSFDDTMNNYTFADGTPFGINIEEE